MNKATLKFKPLEIKDGERIRKFFTRTPSRQLIDCFEAFWLWRDVYGIRFAVAEGLLFFMMTFESRSVFFYPFGRGDIREGVDQIVSLCRKSNIPLLFHKVNREQKETLESLFPGCFSAEAHREQAEYIYSADTFRTYAGKSLQPKRNYVNFARKNYDYLYEPVTGANLADCAEFITAFDGDDTFASDNHALRAALADYRQLKLDGGIIRVDGRIAALFICSPLGDGETAAGMFLRGRHDLKGVIPLVYQEFFMHHPHYRYFNLAEDLGIDGLRKNKLSFYPCELLELYEMKTIKPLR